MNWRKRRKKYSTILKHLTIRRKHTYMRDPLRVPRMLSMTNPTALVLSIRLFLKPLKKGPYRFFWELVIGQWPKKKSKSSSRIGSTYGILRKKDPISTSFQNLSLRHCLCENLLTMEQTYIFLSNRIIMQYWIWNRIYTITFNIHNLAAICCMYLFFSENKIGCLMSRTNKNAI